MLPISMMVEGEYPCSTVKSGRPSKNEMTADENARSGMETISGQAMTIWKGTLASIVASACQKPAVTCTIQ